MSHTYTSGFTSDIFRVSSSLDHFVDQQQSIQDDLNPSLSFGLIGGIQSVPKDFILRNILVGSPTGIKQAVANWGEQLRKWHSKSLDWREKGFEMRYFGYYTDAGAYYYYNTEEGMNYDETFEFIREYTDRVNIPVRFSQYDSWFYPHGIGNGGLSWEFRTDQGFFPEGERKAFEKHKFPLVAHNRWFGPDIIYAKQNGGDYEFIIEDND